MAGGGVTPSSSEKTKRRPMKSKTLRIICIYGTMMVMEIVLITKKLNGWELPWLWVFSPIWTHVLEGFVGGFIAGFIEAMCREDTD